MVNYDPLWDYLHFHKINKTDLADRCKFSRATLSKMGKNIPVALDVIDRIAQELNIPIEDIVRIEKDIPITRNE